MKDRWKSITMISLTLSYIKSSITLKWIQKQWCSSVVHVCLSRLIVWLVMSGRVGETSLRDCAALYMCLRERDFPVAMVTGCGISCWWSGSIWVPARYVFNKVNDPSSTWLTWMMGTNGRSPETMTMLESVTPSASSCSLKHSQKDKAVTTGWGVWAVTAGERYGSDGCRDHNMSHHHHHHVGVKSARAHSAEVHRHRFIRHLLDGVTHLKKAGFISLQAQIRKHREPSSG